MKKLFTTIFLVLFCLNAFADYTVQIADGTYTLTYGETLPYKAEQNNLMAYFRRGEKNILVVGNFQKEPQDILLPEGMTKVILNNMPSQSIENGLLHLEGYQLLVIA